MTVTRLSDGTEQADFRYDFALDGKALSHEVDENGDLWIEGFASDWGVDRQDEAFEPDAFEKGLKSFLDRNPIMLYHHQYDKALGQFVDAQVRPEGLWVKGRVDAPATGSWAEDVFNKIRKGTIKAFSVGGIFRRRNTAQGPRIYDVDLGEISVTPFPVNPRTTFAVVAKKAFETGTTVVGVESPEIIAPGSETECEKCKAREAEAEEARLAAEREAQENATAEQALSERIAESEARVAAAEAALAEERVKREALEAEVSAAAVVEETPEQKELAALFAKLDALGTTFDEVAERLATEDAPSSDKADDAPTE